MWREVAFVAVGGAVGSSGRYLVGRVLPANPEGWPWATFTVNLVGCLLIGLLMGFWGAKPEAASLRLLFITGLLGGFTTFSAFAFESASRPIAVASAYMVTSVLGGLVLAIAGKAIAAAVIGFPSA